MCVPRHRKSHPASKRAGKLPMAPPLTIRNHTFVPIELKLIERYEAPRPDVPQSLSQIPRFGQSASSHVAKGTPVGAPSAPQLAASSQRFEHQDVDIRIEPFATFRTDIRATERSGSEVLRLTLEADGQRYRIDTPSPKSASQKFTPLVPDPRHHFTGVFTPKDTHLAVFSSTNLRKWMRELADSCSLSALSIPGTHNSPTYYRALPTVRCQAVSPKAQLENGVRFLDIRVQPQNPDDPRKDGLLLVHGVFPISLTGNKHLRAVIDDTLTFLAANPSETVIMSLKREGPGNATDEQLSRILHDHYAYDPRHWYTEPRIPTLGESRGKIVLMRRFVLDDALKHEHGGRGWGINAENWRYNSPHDTYGAVCVQDFCEVLETENIDQKIAYAQDHLARSGACSTPVDHSASRPERFFLNFLSASNFWKVACWPEKIAAKLNPAIVEHLCAKHGDGGQGDGTTGVVVCDWLGGGDDWDLVRCIVGMNARLMVKGNRGA